MVDNRTAFITDKKSGEHYYNCESRSQNELTRERVRTHIY